MSVYLTQDLQIGNKYKQIEEEKNVYKSKKNKSDLQPLPEFLTLAYFYCLFALV